MGVRLGDRPDLGAHGSRLMRMECEDTTAAGETAPAASGRIVGELSPGGSHVWGGAGVWERLWLRPDEVAGAARACFACVTDSPRFLVEGMLNESWRIDTPRGCFVLRVSRPDVSREQLSYEHAVLHELHRHIPEVVPPLAGADGRTVQVWRGRLLSLFPYVDGVLGSAVDPRDRSPQAASMLARIHRLGLDLPRPQRPGFGRTDERPRWIWPRLRPVLVRELSGTEGFEEMCGLFDREMAALDAWLDALGASLRRMPCALVHGDYNPRNLIFSDGRLAAVIDWDGCHVDYLAWEVAQVACADGVDSEGFWRAYLDAGGPLADRDHDLLGGFARVGMFSEVQWTVDGGRVNPRGIELVREIAEGVEYQRARHPALIH